MKNIQTLYLVLLIALFPGMVKSENEPANEVEIADSVWAKLAATKAAATLRLDAAVNQKWGAPYMGVFISDDGLALIQLMALSNKAKPTVVTANGVRLELGTILKLFPSHGLALINFEHRPEAHLEIADKEPGVGESIALLPSDFSERGTVKGGVSPVVGPIMAKRSGLNFDFGYRFSKRLSLGSRLTVQQRPHVTTGVTAINRSGALVATFHSQSYFGTQPLLILNPVVALADVISEIDGEDEGLPFPLPNADVIFDPVLSDPAYNRLAAGRRAGQTPEESHRLLKDLLLRFPKSHRLKDKALQSYAPENPLVNLEDFPEASPVDPVAYQASVLSCRAFLHVEERSIDLGVQARKDAIALSPENYPMDRYFLARLYMGINRIDDAEEILREIYPYLSDRIDVVDVYRGLLLKASKWDELEQVEKRIEELDQTYRPR
jgi:hypothetical protein